MNEAEMTALAVESLRSVTDMQAQMQSQMRDLVDDIRSRATASSGNITIQAGGITNAIALVAAATSVLVVGLFAGWQMLQINSIKADVAQAQQNTSDRESAWISRWNNEIIAMKAKINERR